MWKNKEAAIALLSESHVMELHIDDDGLPFFWGKGAVPKTGDLCNVWYYCDEKCGFKALADSIKKVRFIGSGEERTDFE